jgi:hypothetical protein
MQPTVRCVAARGWVESRGEACQKVKMCKAHYGAEQLMTWIFRFLAVIISQMQLKNRRRFATGTCHSGSAQRILHKCTWAVRGAALHPAPHTTAPDQRGAQPLDSPRLLTLLTSFGVLRGGREGSELFVLCCCLTNEGRFGKWSGGGAIAVPHSSRPRPKMPTLRKRCALHGPPHCGCPVDR